MNNRLYVGNLAFHTTEDVLNRTFSQCGTVSETKLVLDRESGRSRGFAFVAMSTDEEAQKAIQELDGADLDGRALRVNIAEERRPRSDGGGGGGFRAGQDRGNGGPRRGGDRRY
jgi:cold-inducible RNA-binding protein